MLKKYITPALGTLDSSSTGSRQQHKRYMPNKRIYCIKIMSAYDPKQTFGSGNLPEQCGSVTIGGLIDELKNLAR